MLRGIFDPRIFDPKIFDTGKKEEVKILEGGGLPTDSQEVYHLTISDESRIRPIELSLSIGRVEVDGLIIEIPFVSGSKRIEGILNNIRINKVIAEGKVIISGSADIKRNLPIFVMVNEVYPLGSFEGEEELFNLLLEI